MARCHVFFDGIIENSHFEVVFEGKNSQGCVLLQAYMQNVKYVDSGNFIAALDDILMDESFLQLSPVAEASSKAV